MTILQIKLPIRTVLSIIFWLQLIKILFRWLVRPKGWGKNSSGSDFSSGRHHFSLQAGSRRAWKKRICPITIAPVSEFFSFALVFFLVSVLAGSLFARYHHLLNTLLPSCKLSRSTAVFTHKPYCKISFVVRTRRVYNIKVLIIQLHFEEYTNNAQNEYKYHAAFVLQRTG